MVTTLPKSLGGYLKASRMGYHWCGKYNLYIRISFAGQNFHVEVCPEYCIHSYADARQKGDKTYLPWWENKEKEIEILAILESVLQLKKKFLGERTFLFTENFELVQAGG